MQATRMAKAHRSAQNSHPGNPLLPRLENNGLVKEMLTEPIIFADEDTQQRCFLSTGICSVDQGPRQRLIRMPATWPNQTPIRQNTVDASIYAPLANHSSFRTRLSVSRLNEENVV
jgi:hypothetical protein